VSLRGRVFGYVAAAALAACLLTVAVAVALVRHRVADQRVAALDREADAVAAFAPAAGSQAFRLVDGRLQPIGPLRAEQVLAAVRPDAAAEGTVGVEGRSLLYAQRRTTGGRVVVVRPAALAFGEWRPFLASLLLAGLGGALLAALSSWLLARRLTRPIARLSEATAQLASGTPGVSVPIAGEDELAELGRSFNRMAAELGRSRVQQREFLESVSHELKTPLTSIRGYAEALQDAAVAPERAAVVIGAEAQRLERLVADLLDLARLTRAEFDVQRAPVDLALVASRVLERHLPRALELSVALEVRETGPAPAIGDPDRILQAVSNLVENALRVTPAGGAVTVEAAPGQISVTDTGPGLAPEDLPHAFERFYLHERLRAERPVGSGLGLAIVYELAVAMGGSVEVESVPGAGARFTLRLALA
jgi:two-component system OmpR family sensor kinase